MKYAATALLILLLGSYELKSQDLAFTSIREVPNVKRGKSYEVNWQGGNRADNISIALIDKKSNHITISALGNNGTCVVRIPSRVKPGSYTIRVTNATTGDVAFSENISIRRRVPLGVVITAVVLIPVTIYLVATSGPEEIPAAADTGQSQLMNPLQGPTIGTCSKSLIAIAIIASASCSDPPTQLTRSEEEIVTNEVQQALNNYYADIREKA